MVVVGVPSHVGFRFPVKISRVGEAGIPAPVVVGEGVVEDSGAYLQ